MGRRKGSGMANGKTISMSVRLLPEELEALRAIADRIGNGASVTGIIRQVIIDRIAKENA